MFFSITKQQDSRFPNQWQCGNLWVNCDHGWQQPTPTQWTKGYYDNHCALQMTEIGAKITHSTPRSFPLWHGPGIATNLPCDTASTRAWADDDLIMDFEGNVLATKRPIDCSVSDQPLTLQQVKQLIVDHLSQSLDQLQKMQIQNLKLFCSGGIDTLMLYAMLMRDRIDFELITHEYYDYDMFTCHNSKTLKLFWAYEQIHHWNQPTWLATGSCGDEYFLRGPAVIAMLTSWHDINFGELLEQNKDKYHYYHFNKYHDLWTESWKTRHQLRHQYPTIHDLNQQIINHLVNDHQHWHLGNTMTWTPFKNIEIAKILLRCDIQDLLPQFLDGEFNKSLIEDFYPGSIGFLSKFKNTNNKQVLPDFFQWHVNNSML